MADENIPEWDRPSSGDNIPEWDRPRGGSTATASQSLTPETDRAIGQQFSIDRTPRRPPAPTGMMSWFRRNRVSRPSAPVTDPGTPAPVTVPPPGMSSPSPTPTVDASTGLAPSALPSPPGTTPSGSWFDQGKDVAQQRTPFTPPPGVTPYPLPPGASEPSPGFDGPPDRSTGAAVAGGFARNVAPMAAFGAGFELASGPSAAVGGAIGTAIVPGLGTAIGSGLGWLIGGSVAGGLAYAGTKWGQDKLAKKISPHGIFSPEVEEMQEKEHPLASMIGAASAGGKPNPKNLVDAGMFLARGEGRAALVEFAKNGAKNLNEDGLKQVHNVMNVAQAGGLGVAFKVKDQIEAGKFDPKDFATGVGIQLLFNDQWHFPHNATDAKVGQKLIDDVNKGFRKQEQQAGIIPPPPVEPGATIMDPVEAKRRGLERLQSESARVQPPKEGGDPDATQVESTAPVPGGDKGPQVGKGTSLFPLDKGPAGARSGEEPVSPGQTVAAKAPPADEVAIAQGVLKPDAPFRTRINLRAGSNEPLYVRLVDGSEHRIGPITPIRQDGEIVLDDGNTVDPRVVKEFLDENRNPIVDQLKETGKKAAEIVAEDETRRKPEAPLPGHGKAIKDMTDEELADKVEALGPKHPIAPVLKAELKLREEAAKRESEKDQLKETQEHFQRGGDELVDVLKWHGLPAIADSNKQYHGEINYLRAMFRGGSTGMSGRYGGLVTGTGEKLLYRDIFQKGGGTLDSLVDTLKRAGFENPDGSPVNSVSDALELIQNRLHTGKLVYGNEAKAQELESKSFQDYQPPMKSLFGKKERHPFDVPDPQTVHEELAADEGKGAEVVSSTNSKPLSATPGTDTLSMGADLKQIYRKLGADSYKSSITNVIAKEAGIQNPFDAIRDAGYTDKNPGRIDIDIDRNNRTITVKDNGTGMTPEVIEKAFFTVGGSHKESSPENTSGGHGIAKLGTMLGSERVKLVTVRDGLKSVADVTREQLDPGGKFNIVKTHTDEPNGTTVTFKIPERYTDEYGESHPVWFDSDPDFLREPLFGPVEVYRNGELLPLGVHTKGWQKDNRFDFKWGHVDVYVDPSHTTDPKYYVQSAGMNQFRVSPWEIFGFNNSAQINHNMVLDVRSHVTGRHPDYPFNNQREKFAPRRDQDVKDMYNYLKRQGVEQQLLGAKDTFKNLIQLPDFDPEKALTPKQLSEINTAYTQPKRPAVSGAETSPKSVQFTPESVITTHKGGQQTVQTRKAYEAGDRTFKAERDVDFEKTKLNVKNLDPNKAFYHNNTNVEYDDIPGARPLITQLGNTLVKFMRHFGDKLNGVENYGSLVKTDGSGWFGGVSMDKTYSGLNMVNPIKSLWVNPGAMSHDGMFSPRSAAAETFHLFLHELTHVNQRNEGAGFTREMQTNYARLESKHVESAKFQKILENIYEQNWDALKQIVQRHQRYDTSNSAESFKSSGSASAQPGRTKAAGEGASGKHVSEDERLSRQGPTGLGRAEKADRPSGSLGDILAGQDAASKGTPASAPATGAAARPAPAAPRNRYLKEQPPDQAPAQAPAPAAPAVPAEAPPAAPAKPKNRYLKDTPPPVEPVDSHPSREPTRSEKSSTPGQTLTDDQMGQITRSTFNRLTAPKFEGAQPEQIAYMPRNRVIDSGREVIRSGVDPEELVRSRQVPNDQKYAVARAHSEDLREAAHQAEQLARSKPSRENKEAAEMAFADYANWNKQELEPLKTLVNTEFPEMEQEPFDPRHYTDLRHEFVKKNDGKDPSSTQKEMLNRHAEKIQKTIAERNKLLDGYDADLEKRAPELRKDIKDGKGLYDYVADVINKIAPCN